MIGQGQGAWWSRAAPLVALLLAGGASAPVAAQTPSALSACADARKPAYTELAQRHETELRRHVLHPVRVARLKGMATTLVALRTATARKPRNLAECEKTTQALAQAHEQLDRIAGSPAELEACTAANRQLHAEMQAGLLGLQTGTARTPPPLAATAGRMDSLRAAVAREDLALVDCRQLADELAEVHVQVQGLLPQPAPPRQVAAAPAAAPASAPASAPSAAACRETQARTYNELAQAYASLVGGGPVPVEWMAPLQALSGRMKQLHAAIADGAAPGWDCAAVARALAAERSELATLSRR